MRTSLCLGLILLTTVTGVGIGSQGARIDPARVLADRFQFTPRELSQVNQAQPVVKAKIDGDELALVGAVRMPGKKERLSDWVKNVAHFRRSAELGVAQIVPVPPAATAFASVALDPADLAELQHCAAGKCALRVSADALGRLQRDVQWGSPNAASQANDVFRQMLLGYTSAYLKSGNASPLVRRAVTLTAIAPELVTYLERYPQTPLSGADQLFYWSATPASSTTILSVHHLTVYTPRPSEIWIVDTNVYASRYFDAALLLIGLYDAPDGNGFFAVAGSRMMSSQLTGVAGTVLRRQIQRSASDSVKTYLEWIRDSLGAS